MAVLDPEPLGRADDLDPAGDWGGPDDEMDLFTQMNVTPFVDVILVLLIIFMVSSSAMVDAARDGALEVSLPQAGQAQHPADPAAALVLGMAADGQLFLGGRAASQDEVARALHNAHAHDPQTTVIVDADGSLPHHAVVHLMDAVRAAGFERVAIGAQVGP